MDDRVYRIRELPNKSAFKQNDGSIIVKALIPEKNTEIIQRLLPYSRNGQAYVRIEIKMKNLDKIPHTYGVRLMLDTWPGLNDDITFIVPGAKGSEVLTHEVEFTPGWASMWQTYELPLGGNFNASKLCVQNIMTGHGLVPPDKIAFASWPRAYRSEWDYYVNNNISVAGWSSSALLWWNPVTTRAGDANGLRSLMQQFLKADKDEIVSLSKELQPTEADCITVFGEANGKKIYAVYAPEFEKGQMILRVKENQTKIKIDSATGKEMREKAGDSKQFSGGYLSIADKMNADLSYHTVRFIEPGKTRGMRYDVFAFVNGKWRVFPKPYRILDRE